MPSIPPPRTRSWRRPRPRRRECPEDDRNWGWFQVPGTKAPGPPKYSSRDHFEEIKTRVSGAYYSSETGMRELGFTGRTFFEGFPGCTHPGGHE